MSNCSFCKKEIDRRTDNSYVWFSYGRGILCTECYKSYDKEIESIEKKYNVKSGFLTIGQPNRKAELEALLNNTVDDDEAILLRRELEGEEGKSDGR